MKMKITIALVAAFMLTFAVMIAVPMFVRYDDIETDRELEHLLFLHERGGEIRGVGYDYEVRLSRGNLSRVISLLTYTERKLEFFPPAEASDDAIIFTDGVMEVRIVSSQSVGNRDKALIYYTNGSKKRCYSLTGYETVKNIHQAISPEGFNSENTVV